MKKIHKYCIEEDGVYKVCFSMGLGRGAVGMMPKPGASIPEPDWNCADFEGFRNLLEDYLGSPVELMEADEYIRQEMEEPEEAPTP